MSSNIFAFVSAIHKANRNSYFRMAKHVKSERPVKKENTAVLALLLTSCINREKKIEEIFVPAI